MTASALIETGGAVASVVGAETRSQDALRVLFGSALLRLVAAATVALVAPLAYGASNVVQYAYDAAGNIVRIQRGAAVPATIIGFSPTSGPVGTVVTVTGSDFGPTPASNVVTINGAAAAIGAATSTSLVVTVPAGASTGRIAVTVAGSVATSAQDFTVTAAGAPTISAFAPSAGAAGISVAVWGTGFDPAGGATTVKLNQNAATPSAISATQLAFPVPAATGSGRIRVSTGAGTAVAASDFIVPPASIAAADIVASTRLIANGPAQTIGIFAAAKHGAVLFDGAAGDWLSLQLANFAVNPAGWTVSYTIHKPDNTQLGAGTLSADALSIHLPKLPAAGTYLVLLSPGLATVSLDARLEANRTVPADGTPLALATGRGQTVRALFAATAAEQKALMVSGMMTTPAGQSLTYSIATPSGSTFRNGSAMGSGTTTQLPPFSTTGTYATVFTPAAAATRAEFKVALLSGVALAIDDAALPLAIANAGDGARLVFAGVAGQNLGLGISDLTLAPSPAGAVNFSVYKPDATLLATGSCNIDGTQCASNLANLPVSGSYSVIVQPANGATGAMKVWLSRDSTGALAPGTPYNLALGRPGQNARLAFAGAAGAVVAIQVRGIATVPANQGILAVLYRPDGTSHAYLHLTGTGGTIMPIALPVTGNYTVYLEPEPAAKGAATAAMEVLLDPGRSLVVDGATIDATVGVAGGSSRFTFAGTSGQNLGLGVTSLALSPPGDATIFVYKPDGTSLTTLGCYQTNGGCGGNMANLPVAGAYSIVVQPVSGRTGSFGVTLSSDIAGNLALDAPVQLALSRPGQNGRLTFSANAGETVSLGFAQIATTPPGKPVYFNLLQPNGTSLASASSSTISGRIYAPALPVAGVYQVLVDPAAQYLANVAVTRHAGVPLAIDGAAVASTIASPGDSVRYVFSATAGQSLGLALSGITTDPAGAAQVLQIYAPTGASLASPSCYAAGGCAVNLSNLVATGSYSAIIQSIQGATGNVVATLSSDLPGTLVAGGASVPIDLRAGRNARLTIAGIAGQTLRLNWSGAAIAGSIVNALVYVYKPDGSTLVSLQIANASTGGYDLPALPVGGTYAVFIDPPQAASMSAAISLSTR